MSQPVSLPEPWPAAAASSYPPGPDNTSPNSHRAVGRLTAWLLTLLGFAPLGAWAQNAGAAFSCSDGYLYQVRQTGTGATAASALYRVNRPTANFATDLTAA